MKTSASQKQAKVVFMAVAGLMSAVTGAADGTWNAAAGGRWSDTANWVDGVKASGGTATITSITPYSKILLDENVSLTGITNTAGIVYIETEPSGSGAGRFGFTSPNGIFDVYSTQPTRMAATLSGAADVTVKGGGFFAFDAPQEFTGSFGLQSGTGVVDFRWAARTAGPDDEQLVRTRSFVAGANDVTFRVYGRMPREAVSHSCRITPGSPDVVLIAPASDPQSFLSAGMEIDSDAFPAGTFVTRVRQGETGADAVVSLSSAPVASLASGTTQTVTFKALAGGECRQVADTITSSGVYWKNVSFQMTAPEGAAAAFELGKVSYSTFKERIFLKAPDEIGGWDGRFIIGDATGYFNWFSLYDRVLFAMKDIETPPTAETLGSIAPAPALWMDAGKAGTVETDASGVLSWDDVRGEGFPSAVCALERPQVLPSALNGMNVIDFGASGSGRMLAWDREITGIKAAFLVIGSQEGGGTLLGAKEGCATGFRRHRNFKRGINSTDSRYTCDRDCGLVSATAPSGTAFYNAVNGHPVYLLESGLSGGYDVVTLSNPKLSLSASAFAYDPEDPTAGKLLSGGQRLAEVLVFTNDLTIVQAKKIEAYLAKKWLGLDTDGFGAARVNEVALGSSDSFPRIGYDGASGSAKIGRIRSDGEGRGFEVPSGTDLSVMSCPTGMTVKLNQGSALRLGVKPRLSAPYPEGLVLHIDASAGDSVVEEDGEVVSVKNFAPSGVTPYLYPANVKPVREQTDGKWFIDLGDFGGGCCLRAFTNFMARTVFLVTSEKAYGTQALGSLKTGYVDDAHPSSVSTGYRSLDTYDFYRYGWASFVNRHSGYNAVNGRWWYDGEYVMDLANETRPLNTLQMITGVMEGWGGLVSAIGGWGFDGTEATYAKSGGFKIAEIVIYDRTLSDAERRDVDAYLKKKWLGRETDGVVDGVFDIAAIELAGDAVFEAPEGTLVKIGSLTGTGKLTFASGTQAAVVESADTAAVEGAGVSVRPLRPASIAAGAALHVDASDVSRFTMMRSGNEYYAKFYSDLVSGQTLMSAWGEGSWVPKTNWFGGKVVIDFDRYAVQYRSYRWPNRLTGIRTVFWMFRDHPVQGGGWLLGDSQAVWPHPSDFTRGNQGYDYGASGYFDPTYASPAVFHGDLRKNGRPVAPTASPGGDWQVLSLVTTNACAADQICADRLTDNKAHWGGLQLGELIIYERVLDEAERKSTEEYLASKWLGKHIDGFYGDSCSGYVASETVVTAGGDACISGFEGTGTVLVDGGDLTVLDNGRAFSGTVVLTNGAHVVLASGDYSATKWIVHPGAVLDCGGRALEFMSVTGGGTVTGGDVTVSDVPKIYETPARIYLTVEEGLTVAGEYLGKGVKVLCSEWHGMTVIVR